MKLDGKDYNTRTVTCVCVRVCVRPTARGVRNLHTAFVDDYITKLNCLRSLPTQRKVSERNEYRK